MTPQEQIQQFVEEEVDKLEAAYEAIPDSPEPSLEEITEGHLEPYRIPTRATIRRSIRKGLEIALGKTKEQIEAEIKLLDGKA